jgi:endonuclease-3
VVAEVDRILSEYFGDPIPSLRPPLDCLINTILSQNTNDALRDRAYGALRKRYPSWEKCYRAGVIQIEHTIHIAGLYRQKARSIYAALSWAKREKDGWKLHRLCHMPVKEAREALLSIPGVGLKTASVVLCFACGKDVFPVDTHVARLSGRLGFVPADASRDDIYWLMEPLVPEGRAAQLHLNLIHLGRTVCRARNPLCSRCPLNSLCPSRLYAADESGVHSNPPCAFDGGDE